MNLFSRDKSKAVKDIDNYEQFISFILGKGDGKNYIYNIAEAHAIELIARTISSCEIQTFEKIKNNIKKNKGKLYWALNISPNDNETGTQFIYKLMLQLLIEKKALVLINKFKDEVFLHVASDFKVSKDIIHPKKFTDIKLEDDEKNTLLLKKTYDTNSAIYFSIKNDKIKSYDDFKENTAKILSAAQKCFNISNFPKWRLKNPGGQPTLIDFKTKKPIDYEKYTTQITEGLLDEKESVILLSEIFDLINLNEKNSKDFSDFQKIFKTISDAVAQKWNIPLDIFYGTETEKSNAMNNFVTLALIFYFELLEDGFNKSLVGKEDFIKGEYIKINRLNINHKDLIDKASGWDKLISNGFSFNQLSEITGLPEINEEWANKHYITKNYANVEGGEKEDE